ncbi:MAG: glycosyltransferase family 2 protein [Bacteroidota bacterium]
MIGKSEINIFIPAYNEAATIAQVIQDIRSLGYQKIFVVDDGSTDQTNAQATHAEAEIITHLINRGAGAATQTAIECARQLNLQYILLMDADGQHLPQDIDKLVKRMSKGDCDLVIGSRFLNNVQGMPLSRKWFNHIANWLTNLVCQKHYTDSQSGLRMLNRKAVERLHLKLDEFGFCSEMIYLAEQGNLIIAEVPTETVYTPYSLNKGQNFFKGIQTALSLISKIIFR